MATPTDKAPAIDSLLEKLFPGRMESIRDDVCVMCKGPASEFEDALSRKEFSISGMCQKCQDKVFTSEEEELNGGTT